MAHIAEIKIEQYRGIGGTELSNFGDVNLIVGDNGTGKTSILESIWLFGGRANTTLLWQNQIQRTDVLEVDPIRTLEVNKIELVGVEVQADGERRRSRYELEFVGKASDWSKDERLKQVIQAIASAPQVPGLPPGPKTLAGEVRARVNGQLIIGGEHGINMHMIGNQLVLAPNVNMGSTAHGVLTGVTDLARLNQQAGEWYSAIASRGPAAKRAFVKALQVVRPEIENIEMIPRMLEGQAAPYFQVEVEGDRVLRAEAIGNGFRKVLDLTLSVSAATGGILLIDELENGINPQRMAGFARALLYTARKYETQIIATTHSRSLTETFTNVVEQDEGKALKQDGTKIRIFDVDHKQNGVIRGEDETAYRRRVQP